MLMRKTRVSFAEINTETFEPTSYQSEWKKKDIFKYLKKSVAFGLERKESKTNIIALEIYI